MCPVMDVSELTLAMMWGAGLQLVVFYHCDAVCQRHFQLWPPTCIASPWHNTVSCPALVIITIGLLVLHYTHTYTRIMALCPGLPR